MNPLDPIKSVNLPNLNYPSAKWKCTVSVYSTKQGTGCPKNIHDKNQTKAAESPFQIIRSKTLPQLQVAAATTPCKKTDFCNFAGTSLPHCKDLFKFNSNSLGHWCISQGEGEGAAKVFKSVQPNVIIL